MATEVVGDITVESTPGIAANSYVSIADTKLIWDLDPYKTCPLNTDEEFAKAVITATSQLDSQYWNKYRGLLYDETFTLHFPRTSICDSRGIAITDYAIFPPELAKATAMQAWYVLDSNRREEPTVSGVKQLKMDGLGSKTFFSTAAQLNNQKTTISTETSEIISPYVIGNASKYTSTMYKG